MTYVYFTEGEMTALVAVVVIAVAALLGIAAYLLAKRRRDAKKAGKKHDAVEAGLPPTADMSETHGSGAAPPARHLSRGPDLDDGGFDGRPARDGAGDGDEDVDGPDLGGPGSAKSTAGTRVVTSFAKDKKKPVEKALTPEEAEFKQLLVWDGVPKRTCARCGAELSAHAERCPACGQRV